MIKSYRDVVADNSEYDMRIVNVCPYNGGFLVATTHQLFVLKDDKLEIVKFYTEDTI